jgi:conserved oligomeric Golgi complex subunit 6
VGFGKLIIVIIFSSAFSSSPLVLCTLKHRESPCCYSCNSGKKVKKVTSPALCEFHYRLSLLNRTFRISSMQPQCGSLTGPPMAAQTAASAEGVVHLAPLQPGSAPPAFSAASTAEAQGATTTTFSSLTPSSTAPVHPSSAPLAAKAAVSSPSCGSTTAPSAQAGAAATATAAFVSTKNNATQRKVAKLLDITTSSDIKDLASYVDEVLPGYFYSVDVDSNAKGKDDGETAFSSSNVGGPSAAALGGRAVTSAALRSALDRRAIDMHKSFLQEFTAVYQNYQRVAAKVNELQDKCTGLENVLSSSTGGSEAAADEFFYQIQLHQAELQLVQHHEKEVDDFRKQHHFGPAEQQVLEEGPVDMNFLNVLERAREVHRRSSELMQSQEYHQGAAAVMESTYAAIARATEKIARHLLATAGTASASSGRGDAGAAVATTGGVGSIAADVPEVTGFQLRCVRLLYEESPSLHEKFLDEVARLRRASVLRRYFHLLTTGSANTASGMYFSGGQLRSDVDGRTSGDAGAVGMGTRPLEAELNNPTYFFSSLCAWLHQTIVEEQDFLHTFFMNDETDMQAAGRRGSAAVQGGASSVAPAAASTFVDVERVRQDMARQQALLDSAFGGVCKHIRAALDNVLERLGRFASALGPASGEGQKGSSVSGFSEEVEAKDSGSGSGSNAPVTPQKGLRGLSGGLTRLFMAATGRSPLGSLRRQSDDESNALLQRYATITSRAQQEAVALSVLHAPLQGVQTCVTLVQLFEYYSATTFTPLLGEKSALTRLIRETAPQLTRDVFQRLLRVLAAHLLDSTAGVISRTATLRRLASSNALNSTAAGAGDRSTDATGAPSSPASAYILDFLTSMTYGDDTEGVPNPSVQGSADDSKSDLSASAAPLPLSASTANAKFRQTSDGQLQRHSAQDLKRVLAQLILPPSPEVMAYCSVLNAVLRDTSRQADLLQAIMEQQQQQQHQAMGAVAPSAPSTSAAKEGDSTTVAGGGPFRLHTEVKGFVQELLQALWRSAQSVQEDSTLRTNLDDPCRAILQYNMLYQLQEIMEQHSDVLDLLCEATTESGSVEKKEDMRHDMDTLRAEVGSSMNALRRRLLAQWETAVEHFYFPLSTEAVIMAALTANTTTATTAAGASDAEDQRTMASKKDTRRVLKQIVNVYNTVASMGHLPEPVPLLLALCGSESMRRAVGEEITKNVVERVYPVQFNALQKLPPNEELTAVQEEMSPQNLVLLVDFNSPSASAL